MKALREPTQAVLLRSQDYLLENVFERMTGERCREVIAFWREEQAVTNPAEAARRAPETVLLVRAVSGQLAGISTAGKARLHDGRLFYTFRMFLRRSARVPYLMVAVIETTAAILDQNRLERFPAAGMLVITENPKLMRPGIRKLFLRHGYRDYGKTERGLDAWVREFQYPCAKEELSNAN